MMKKTVTIFVLGMMSAQAVAQQAVVVGGGSGTTLANVGAGKYDFSNISQNTTEIALKAMDQAGVTRDLDRRFIQELTDKMSSKIKELVALHVKMTAVSSKSIAQGASFETDYFPLANAIKAKNAEIEAELMTNSAISPEALPSYEPIQVGGLQVSAPASTKINLAPVIDKLDTARRTILGAINEIKMGRVITANGQQIRFAGQDTLSPDLSNLQLLNPQQIEAMQKQILALNQVGSTTRGLNQQFVNALVPMINSFVKNYGTEERFRFRDENDAKAKAQALTQITDAFYRRSYLRKKYGISMGAIQPNPVLGYPKSILNLEKFGLKPLTQAIGSISTQAAVMDTEIMNAFESTRNFVQLFDEKVTPVFKSKQKIVKIKQFNGQVRQMNMDSDFISKDTGFLARANSAVTFLTGNQPTAEVMLAVMRMILADIKEEMFLLQNDRASLANYHDLRFRSTPQLKDLANLRMCQFDIGMPVEAFNMGCASLKGKTIGGVVMADQGNKLVGAITVSQLIRPTLQNAGTAGTISHTTAAWINNFNNVEAAVRIKAKNLQDQIDASLQAGKSDEQRQEELDQALDLFK